MGGLLRRAATRSCACRPTSSGGTALTPVQARILTRPAAPGGGELVVAFDAETSGQAAPARAYTLRAAGISPTTAELPAGTDPAALVAGRGRRALRAALAGAVTRPLVEVAIAPPIAPHADRLDTVEGRVAAARAAAAGHRPGRARRRAGHRPGRRPGPSPGHRHR